MPLNPNGKIDKPALPFPDTAQAAALERSRTGATAGLQGNPTEQAIAKIWMALLPNAPQPVPLDESFFDLGGHSILATRLIFEMRKTFVIDAPLGLVFDHPSISGLAAAVDNLRQADLGLMFKDGVEGASKTNGLLSVPNAGATKVYGQDLEDLSSELRAKYPAPTPDMMRQPQTVFLTGATGFLGAFILRELAVHPNVKKIVCLVRASDAQKGLSRLREGSIDRNVWDEDWVESGRLEVIAGDLALANFGLSETSWQQLSESVDAIVHNGALVSLACRPSVQSAYF
jgi:L-aminoadipate-semialdehyde dehydrogenase